MELAFEQKQRSCLHRTAHLSLAQEQTQALITAPVDGCYMTGVGDLTGNTAKIDYAAIVTPLSNTMKNATVANVVFVIEWDTVA